MNNEFPSFEELNDMDDHDILILVVQKLRSVSINQCNHLKHHEETNKRYWKIIFICIAAGLTGLVNLGTALSIIFFKV